MGNLNLMGLSRVGEAVGSSYFSAPTPGGWTIIAEAEAVSLDGNSVTIAAIDTTGADLLILYVTAYNVGTFAGSDFSDSEGNTWSIAAPELSNSDVSGCIAYVDAADVSATHTFTFTETGTFPSLFVIAVAGGATPALDEENGANSDVGSVTSQAAGSITPTEDGCLIIAGVSSYAAGSDYSIDGGFTISNQIAFSGGNNMGGGIAYLEQGAAGAVDPTWSWSSSTNATASIASFKHS